jgi:hypothetical protein
MGGGGGEWGVLKGLKRVICFPTSQEYLLKFKLTFPKSYQISYFKFLTLSDLTFAESPR